MADALDAIRTSSAAHESLQLIFVVDGDGLPVGQVTPVALIRANPSSLITTVQRPNAAKVYVDNDLDQVARKLSDFNLMAIAVLDRATKMVVGVVTIDDVIDVLLPQGWRRDLAGDEEQA